MGYCRHLGLHRNSTVAVLAVELGVQENISAEFIGTSADFCFASLICVDSEVKMDFL